MSVAACHRILAGRSLSFRLASRLLPRDVRDDAAVVYAWCRRCDDAVDERPPEEHDAALALLRRELDELYAGRALADPIADAFAEVVRRRGIPEAYPSELLRGMEMDVRGVRYETLEDLLLYCHRAAGTVGLMMCHVMGAAHPAALRRAAHLGIAMQLTNVCRDVHEDWLRGRLYLPAALLEEEGVGFVARAAGGPVPAGVGPALAPVVRRLLGEADRFYRSGDLGLSELPWRCALAVKAARLLYAAIGARIARQGHDVFTGRAVVPGARKLLLVGRAAAGAVASLPGRLRGRSSPALLPAPTRTRFPDDVLPL
jgi:15-cis-phytoene synthase